jgi:hypothetical protein
MIELNTLEDIRDINTADNMFGKALYERMEWFFNNLGVNRMEDIETVRLFAIESQDELEGLIIIKDNLNDNIEYIERSFIYITENNNIINHISFLHFNFFNQDLDLTKEYIIREDLINNQLYKDIINPHVDNVYNEDWEKKHHEG